MPKRVSPKTHQKQKMRYNARSRSYAYNAKRKWKNNEEDLVSNHVMPDSVLSKKIGRSIQAIHTKRNRLKWI